ncbi:ANTAR domain-containing protein [Actinoplanes bogorensis]|uniref:ANTAR domain-containing protein n=1 Tax=Paractinoplanes bogorensis TaxID=1610840 RepID=A0ABS5YU08_9ACTN|nr:ANTAR domain-containing protein [Actinoplanes bogorensis]MBU2666905.1 ANTAR domain-containing protein [Actinoplanes bogorensis]
MPGAEAVSISLTGEDGPATFSGDPEAVKALSLELPISAEVTGTLDIYGRAGDEFEDEDAVRAKAFAGWAAVAIANAHAYFHAVTLAAQLREAMSSRAVIEQAKGVIMAQRRCKPDEAFAFLTRASQDSNHKVRDVAAALVADLAPVRRGVN